MIFTTFQPQDYTGVKNTEITTGLWSPNETGSLASTYTSSVQAGISGEYFYDLYSTNPATDTEAEVQFSVAYGHRLASGSPSLANMATSTLPTQVIYSQYRNLLVSSGSSFTFNAVESDDIYVININRARLKQSLDPGNWQIGLSGSLGVKTFIDDSGLSTSVVGNILASNVYNVRSGSIVTGVNVDATIYGLAFPDYGVIILHPAAISASVGLATANLAVTTGYKYNHNILVGAISGAMARSQPFKARSAENVSSQNYFVRLRNGEYNYTNNPSYYTITSDGTREVLDVFKEKPLTYITTIGMYNNQNELLAVAKLSRPIQKSEDKEALIRVRLDY